ncbi:hypothetical protein M3Y98_00843100 [Aphelenchoides besseyi]|nr:hypothetical protein M3Y98_00843100 [Aphelenchoides besseyi]KAI6202482.1 hypothetical protein M3Y96_00953700 [Aphelenchoides besseyi]
MTALFMLLVIDAYLLGREHKQPFEKDRVFLSKIGQIYLEDYFHMDVVQPQRTLKRLQMSATVVNWTHEANSLDYFYKTAVKHLKTAAPNLKTIDLYGGYVQNPQNMTELSLKHELEVINRTLSAIYRTLTITYTIEECSFDAIIAIDRDTVESTDYKQFLASIFNYQVDRISAYNLRFSIPMHFGSLINDCTLQLHFDSSYRSHPWGRSRFILSRPTDYTEPGTSLQIEVHSMNNDNQSLKQATTNDSRKTFENENHIEDK